jgi:hypothetical protein
VGHSGGGGAKEVRVCWCGQDWATRRPPFYRAGYCKMRGWGGVNLLVSAL